MNTIRWILALAALIVLLLPLLLGESASLLPLFTQGDKLRHIIGACLGSLGMAFLLLGRPLRFDALLLGCLISFALSYVWEIVQRRFGLGDFDFGDVAANAVGCYFALVIGSLPWPRRNRTRRGRHHRGGY